MSLPPPVNSLLPPAITAVTAAMSPLIDKQKAEQQKMEQTEKQRQTLKHEKRINIIGINSDNKNNNNKTKNNKNKKRKLNKPKIKFSDSYIYDGVCPFDKMRFSEERDFKQHHTKCHMDTKYECPLCKTSSASWHNYAYHIQKQEHNGTCPPPWICKLELPPLLNINKKAHSTINKQQQQKPETSKEENKDKKLCKKRFGSKYQLQSHIKSEHTNVILIDPVKF